MSYGCFEVGCWGENVANENITKITPWNPVRMTLSVCCFLQHMIKNSSMQLSFVLVDLPFDHLFDSNSLGKLRNFSLQAIPDIQMCSSEKREMFCVYAMSFLKNINQVPHTFLHATCCYCGNYLCTKHHFDFNFVEIIQRQEVWHYFSSNIIFSDPFHSQIHLTREMHSLIFMVDFVFNIYTVYNVGTNKVEACRTLNPELNKKIKTLYPTKNPFPLSTYCFQCMWFEDMDWNKLPLIIPEKCLKRYPLYHFHNAMKAFTSASSKNCHLKHYRNYKKSF